jgi:hypothetical protein
MTSWSKCPGHSLFAKPVIQGEIHYEDRIGLAVHAGGAVGLYQQQQSAAAGKIHHRRCAAQLGYHGSVFGWLQGAVPLSLRLRRQALHLSPDLAGKCNAGASNRERCRVQGLRSPGIAGVQG